MLLHIGAVPFEVNNHHPTPWHTLAPQTRVLCALLVVFATALTPHGHWWTWGVYGAGIAMLILLSRVRLPVLLRRVAVEFVFIGVVVLGTLFRGGGTVLWQWGWLSITTVGLVILGSVALKALLCLLMMNLLVMTTSVADLLQALIALRLPPLLVAILASMYRYIGVLADEFNTMRRAAASRNLISRSRWQRLVVGNMIGSLFIRTYERGDRIHQAMLARGYTGIPVPVATRSVRPRDYMALTLTVAVLLLGQAVHLLAGR